MATLQSLTDWQRRIKLTVPNRSSAFVSNKSKMAGPSSGRGSIAKLQQLLDKHQHPLGRSPGAGVGRAKLLEGLLPPTNGGTTEHATNGTNGHTNGLNGLPQGPKIGVGRGAMMQQLLKESICVEQRPDMFIKNTTENKKNNVTHKLNGAVDKLQISHEQKSMPTESFECEPISKKGTSGHSVEMYSNYLALSLKSGFSVFEYQVSFDPAIDYKSFRIKLMKSIEDVFGPNVYVGENLYLPIKIKDLTKSCKHPIEDTSVEIQIKFIKEKPAKDLCYFYNIMFKRIMAELKFKRMRNDNFDQEQSRMIPHHKLQVWPGYVTAVNEHEGGIMLTLDPTHRVLRTINALDEMKPIFYHNKGDAQAAIKAAFIGKAVITTYNCKLYTIDDVDFSVNPLSTFPTRGGDEITFMEYYLSNYGKEIKDLKQPMFISRSRERSKNVKSEERMICLIPELCVMTGLTDEMRNNFQLMKDLACFTKITPNQRFSAMKQFLKRVKDNANASKILADWGLSIADEPISLTARELPPEQIIFGNNQKALGSKYDWSREISIYPVITPVDIKTWLILYTKRDEHNTKLFADCLIRCGGPIGIVIDRPKMIMLSSDKIEQYLTKMAELINGEFQLVMCICPVSRDDRYAAIKRFCCVTRPIPSQVINGTTISNQNKLRSVSQRVVLQMNCKLGGTLWTVPLPNIKLMVIGLDVYHCNSSGIKSVAGFVSSYDPNITRFFNRICIQKPGQEIIDNAKQCFLQGLRQYYKYNGDYPDCIVIYRDGVGDGQLSHCESFEVPQFTSCFEEIRSDYSPKFMYIIVQKRNNTRFFKPAGKSELLNPIPGTVIDSSITRKYLYDFYLVSQKVRDSCLVPTHYIVLADSSGWAPDKVQRLTFKMCHLYYNWPGTVRVPAPCQYAHKLAYLIGSSVRKEHDPSLSTSLFYL